MGNDDQAVIERGLEKLTAFAKTPAEKPRPFLENFLRQNRKLVTQALANGHTYRDIAVMLRDAGFKASPETIRRHLHRVMGTTKPARRGGRSDHNTTSPEPRDVGADDARSTSPENSTLGATLPA